jgi:putative serine protease PepD
MNIPRRSVLMVSVALASGAGGAAVATLADGSTTTSTRTVTETAAPSLPAALESGQGLSANAIYERTKNGVVDIKVSQSGSSSSDSPFGDPEQQGQGGTAEGSGFVIDKQGHIATNQHVVDGGGSMEVTFADGSTASAKLVGQDPSTDVAVIKVDADASKLRPLSFADSSKVQVGSSVVAIGSPFGLEGTLTTGVISALDRTIKSPNGYTIAGALQTDAAINHGNSGGPLLDATGAVLGINAQIESDSGGNDGVGFAIPSDTVKKVADGLIDNGSVRHAYLGLQLGDGDGGAQVGAVSAGGPAADAGLRAGDVVTAIDGRRVADSDALVAAVDNHQPGDEVTLTITRDGDSRELQAKLATRPATATG